MWGWIQFYLVPAFNCSYDEWYNVWMCVCGHMCLCQACLHRSEHTLSYLFPSSTLCEAGSLGCWLHMPGPLAWEGLGCSCLQLLLAVLDYRCVLLHPPFKWALGIWTHILILVWQVLCPLNPSSLRWAFLCFYHLYFLRPPWESSPWVWYSGQSTWKEHLVPKKAKEIMLSWLVSMTGQI